MLFFIQNKEAEAKEELKRRAKQLEMQRREQQRRAASGGGGSGGYLGSGSSGGMGSYSPVPRFEAPSPTPARTSSPAPSTLRPPAFKGSGMKLGSKKARQAEFLDALGGEAAVSDDGQSGVSAPPTPGAGSVSTIEPVVTQRTSLPAVAAER